MGAGWGVNHFCQWFPPVLLALPIIIKILCKGFVFVSGLLLFMEILSRIGGPTTITY